MLQQLQAGVLVVCVLMPVRHGSSICPAHEDAPAVYHG